MPIAESERIYLLNKGDIALERLFKQQRINVLDLKRSSVVEEAALSNHGIRDST
jgi:hypothetical protein